MKILFAVALPPPISGQSLSSKAVLDAISPKCRVAVVNLSKRALQPGVDSFGRVVEVMRIFWNLLLKQRGVSRVYFTISESRSGNLKDIVIYVLCFWHLDHMIIHLQGGAGLRRLLAESGWLASLNRFFYRRLAGVIVEGPTQAKMFMDSVRPDRLHVVKNFAAADLFMAPAQIREKFEKGGPIQLLFLSNLIRGKGHVELLSAFRSLGSRNMAYTLNFAGGFESSEEQQRFLVDIRDCPNVKYHGIVSGESKRSLLASAHLFCLPTYYPYEGQPLSILEAYASGCVVVTTLHSGIPDVFSDRNGYVVKERSPESIAEVLLRVVDGYEGLVQVALANNEVASREFTSSRFIDNVSQVICGDLCGRR